MKKECKHIWVEDEMFSSGAIMIVTGTLNDMDRETRIVCKICNFVDYVTVEKLGSLIPNESKKDV